MARAPKYPRCYMSCYKTLQNEIYAYLNSLYNKANITSKILNQCFLVTLDMKVKAL